MHAFLLLAEIFPDAHRVIEGADHDIIYIGPTVDDLVKSSITEEQIYELNICGIFISSEHDGLVKHV